MAKTVFEIRFSRQRVDGLKRGVQYKETGNTTVKCPT